MKVQQFFPGSKSSQTQSTSRAARSTGAAEGKSADFAEALDGARRKPDPRPAETQAPAAKKPAAASRKKQAANEDAEAPLDDAVATQSAATGEAKPPAAGEDEQLSAEPEEPLAKEEGAADADDEIVEVDADLSAITITSNMGPRPPVVDDIEQAGAPEGSRPKPIPICPMPKPQGSVVPAVDALEGEQAADEMMGLSDDVAAAGVVQGFDDLIDEPITDEDLGLAQTAAARTPTTSISPGLPADQAEPVTSDTKQPVEQALPTISSAFVLADDVILDDELSSSPAPVSNEATTPLTPTPLQPQPPKMPATSTPAPVPPPPPQFAEANHPKIVTAVRGELLPHGGSMQIRLDPPELGALQVLVHMTDGVMTASFQTSSDDATRLLSHSLSQLKAVLESQGVSVDKLQVQQSPKDQQTQNDDPRQQQRDPQDDAHRQEQQRKEMLRRMWRKLSIGSDPLDLVA